MIVECDGFEFDFTDALDVFIFDEKDKQKTNYHGLSHAMKAVDIVVELQDYYLFIEVKDFYEPESYTDPKFFSHLCEALKYKYRDSWIYRWCEHKTDKPIKYLCLLELENALLGRVSKELRKQIPVGKASPRWIEEICNDCNVLNFEIWNQRFTAWKVKRI